MIAKYMATALLGTALVSGAAFAQTTTTPPASSPPAASASTGVQQNLKGNWRASKLVGLAVYNESNEKLGDISEILVDNSGKINAVVIGVGGFLGVGQHDIAVSFDKLKWVNEPIRSASADRAPAAPGMSPSSTATPSTTTTGAAGSGSASATKDNWYPDHAVMSGTKDQLKALPAFKYSDYN
ncbi:PRC-barrel domain-containing protein [Bradyrhizobium sp. G127]|jgi:sporulation protein YlmC with PRC-barrel domain|uniref:PRC-barrel domain-containing protein n=1 Tax=Bradyrhizobium sp. G127 TaxID=2904800 RepID=UPI001F176556|nr:PRC-barrel domain-containing protein [Bradyrhizobium sp. G127]MCF2524166.1 PRC-barrel domain-containing protein [Bradyrhizobium sp. G127]